MATWERSWELELPAGSSEELLHGLVIRDLLFGSSYDVEIEGSDKRLAVDFVAGDELTDGTYRLLITAEVEGPEDGELLLQFTEDVLEEAIEEATGLIEQRQELGAIGLDQLTFKVVAEETERWDLVIPDWLAPDDADVPFGFLPFLNSTGKTWPDDSLLNAHGRIVVVPWGKELVLYGLPATEAEAEAE